MSDEYFSNYYYQYLHSTSGFYTNKVQIGSTTSITEAKTTRVSSLQYLPTVAIYSLATLVAGGLSDRALALANTNEGFEQPQTSQQADEHFTETVTPTEAIASPEAFLAREFAPNPSSEFSQASGDILLEVKDNIKLKHQTQQSRALPEASIAKESIPLNKQVATNSDSIEESASHQPASVANLVASDDLESTPEAELCAVVPQTTVNNTVPNQNRVAQVQVQPSPSCREVDRLQNQLRALDEIDVDIVEASPALSIVIPTGFGADDFTGFINGTYQQRTRYSNEDDGAMGIGIGLGDARQAVGVELSYTLASFGSNRDFGSGGFNVKVHRQFANDWAVAVGWNGFLNLRDDNDFEDSIYGVVSKVIRTQDSIDKPFSRVALNLGVGSGQFRTEDDFIDGDDTVGVFGNVAVRVVRPVSLLVEWSGQDLGVGLSIAPFKNVPLVITPAVRDLTGAGNGARFVLGTGFAWKF